MLEDRRKEEGKPRNPFQSMPEALDKQSASKLNGSDEVELQRVIFRNNS
jgi:hypothetical protein